MKTRGKGVRRPSQAALAVVLGLASHAAMALGLGDIRVLSQPGQPLLAEIPVISADPGELEAARVALASPATFARVGLSAPDALVSALRFDLSQDAHGRAVIRVSSEQPVSAPVVSFLVEVDWGRGRLVREYSALVDRPQTAQAVHLPQITAPMAAPSNAIVRDPAPVSVSPVASPDTLAATATAAASAATPARPTPAPAPRAAAVASAPAGSEAAMVVQRGQTLSQIAGQVARQQGASLDQAMVALLQANPHAFVGGSMHRLRAGARLALPDAAELAAINQAQARTVVREQNRQWATSSAPAAVASSTAPTATAQPPSPAPETAAVARGARLEIAPAATGTDPARSIESGTVAGGQGDMQVSEQLRQAREDLATRDAEIAELRERVAELETLRQQQQALIELKDNEMAAASAQTAERPQQDTAVGAAWWWGGGLLLIGAALAAWVARRRKPSPLPPLAAAGAASPADAPTGQDPSDRPDVAPSTEPGPTADAFLAALDKAREDAPETPAAEDGSGPQEAQSVAASTEYTDPAPSVPVPVQTASDDGAPESVAVEVPATDAWADTSVAGAPTIADAATDAATSEAVHGRMTTAVEAAPVLSAELPVEDVVATPGPWGVDLETAEAIQPEPGSRERLELAIAYLDLGDEQTARILLEEVAAATDQTTRSQALELLERLD